MKKQTPLQIARRVDKPLVMSAQDFLDNQKSYNASFEVRKGRPKLCPMTGANARIMRGPGRSVKANSRKDSPKMIDQLAKPSAPPIQTQPFRPEVVYLIEHVAEMMQCDRRWVLNNMLKSTEDGVKPCRHFRRGDKIFILGEWIQEWCRQGAEA